jgi:hypothetical protein
MSPTSFALVESCFWPQPACSKIVLFILPPEVGVTGTCYHAQLFVEKGFLPRLVLNHDPLISASYVTRIVDVSHHRCSAASVIFSDRILCFCPGPASDCNPSIYVSLVAGPTGMPHHAGSFFLVS